jgi:hypothetical protein
MSEPKQPFEFTGGFGQGPAGSMPAGSAFQDENTAAARPDLPAPPFVVENGAAVLVAVTALPVFVVQNDPLAMRSRD